MRRVPFLFWFTIIVATSLRAGPVDSAIVAAMRVEEIGSYAWTATVEEENRFYVVEGKRNQQGYTLVEMPMVTAVQRRLGATRSDVQTAIFRGDEDFVVSTPEGWKSRDELAAVNPAGGRSSGTPGRRVPTPSPRGGRASGGRGFRYSNLQLNLSHPHDELGIIVGGYTEIHATAAAVEGTLSAAGAKLLLVHPGQNEISARDASGTFKLWIKDGVVVRYEVRLSGTIILDPDGNRREIPVRQTVTTELKAIGATNFDVPEEAKRKLG